ncbi:MAG: hypothetical protein ACJ8CR_36915 [Roseiflexaceae bacterium]
MNLELVMTMFDDENAANDAYEIVRKLHKDGAIEIQDVATLVKRRDGTSMIHDARDSEMKTSFLVVAMDCSLTHAHSRRALRVGSAHSHYSLSAPSAHPQR